MEATEIRRLCALGETSRVQYKLRVDSPAKIAAEIVAFANCRGGSILVGVEDKTGDIVGLTYDQVQQASRDIGNAANEIVCPTVYVQTDVVDVDGKLVLVVGVNEGVNKPYKDKGGNIWVKQGSDKRRIVENAEILSLFQESGNFRPDEKGVRRTSLSDIDMVLLNDYLVQYYGRRADEFALPLERLLQNLQIMTPDGQLTLAGLMFFGKNPQMYEPAFVVKAVSFFGNDMAGMDYRDSKDIVGTIPRMFSEGMSFLKANLHSVQAGQSFNSVGRLEVSEVALRELLQNALVHRDYLLQAPVRIMIFDDRVEIVSPGGLPSGMDIDSLLFGKTLQRNPLIANFCAKTMDYRGLGTGILRARKEERSIAFANDEGMQFLVRIDRPTARPSEYGNMVEESDPFDGYMLNARRNRLSVPSAGGRPAYDIRSRCPGLPKGEDYNAVRLLEYCRSPRRILDMMDAMGYDSRTSFRRRLFTPLLDAGLLVPEFGDKINSPKQRYQTAIYLLSVPM